MSAPSQPVYFYGVHRGRVTGVYNTWDECRWAIAGYRYPRHAKFLTIEEARAYVATGVVPKTATHTQMMAGTKRTISEREAGSSRAGDVKTEPIDLTIETNVDSEDTDVIYVHGYGWSKDEGNGTATPIAGVAVWWGGNHRRNFKERCPGDQSMNCAALTAVLRALETVPKCVRPFQIISSSKYATDCINSWLARWLKNGFKGRNGDSIKHEALLRCIAAHLDERRHAGQAVRLVHVPAATDSAGSRGAKAMARRGAQEAAVPPRDYAQLEAGARARMAGPPVPIAHPLESCAPTPRTPPRKKQRVAPAQAAPAFDPHAALRSALYSPRKMAILAQAAAILSIPPTLPPTSAAAPAIIATSDSVFSAAAPIVVAPPPPGRVSRPVVRSKVPRPGRSSASQAPPPPPVKTESR
ncbi:ribonuclease H-like domain-containing protein [Mycena belliarum]|uniref:ribonuclease H n=1 Tax=Mycena belliarum TaxID=1033014 RepID=A0AAD6U5Q5_9AGAR|nr:ribonuclease H-like domain-containing protein [Mycena belliae]